MFRQSLSTLLLAGLCMAAPAFAQSVPDAATERGFVAGKAFSLAQYDAVNLFNGGLSLNIPIGPSYAVGPNFSYQLKLTYSSKVWEYGHPSCTGPTQYPPWIGLQPYNEDCQTAGIASPAWNAGLGWRLGFGFVVDGPITPSGEWWQHLPAGYHSPDGAVHSFFDSLHDTDWNTGEPFPDEFCRLTDDVCFTRDSSYLRLRRIDIDEDTVPVIEFPDGSTTTFGHSEPGNVWLPTRIEDAFGNGVNISYSIDGLTWTIKDDRRGDEEGDETIQVLFEADSTHPNEKRVLQVRFLSPRDQVNRRSQIDFVYHTPPSAEAPYPECAAVGANAGQAPYLGPMLQRVVHPVETSSAPDDWNFDFDYYFHSDDGTNTTPTCDEFAGQIKSMQLPTRAKVVWEYGSYITPAMDCLPPPEPPVGGGPREPPTIIGQKFGGTSGVLERREFKVNSAGNPVSELSYRLYAPGSVHWIADPTCGPALRSPIKHVARVQYQRIGNGKVARTETYFSTYARDEPDAHLFRVEEYGQPLTHAPCSAGAPSCSGITDPLPNPRMANGKEYYLSSTVHRCSDADMTAAWGDQGPGLFRQRALDPSCELFQAKYVRYERSFKTCSTEEGGCSNINSRLVGEMTVHYGKDANGADLEAFFETTDSSHFGGFGIYRETKTGGNVSAPGGGDEANERTTTQDLLPPGEFVVTGQNVSSSLPNPANVNPWWFGHAASVKVTEPGKGTAETLFCYKPSGFLVGRRTLEAFNGTATSANDLVVKYRSGPDDHGGAGFVTSTHHFGGDKSPLGTVDLCATPGENEGEYVITHASTYGVPSYSAFKRNGADFFITLDLDVHRSGVVTASRDHAGVTTSYGYDDRGRVIDIEPQNAARTHIDYDTDHAGGPEARVTLSSGSVIRTEVYHYDQLGRLTEEHRKVPGPAGADIETVRCRNYVEAGFVKLETEFLPAGSCPTLDNTNATEYDDYDPFGRPKHINSPDGKQVKHNYLGGHSKVELRRMMTSTGLVEARTEFLTNRQGNLIQVKEDWIDPVHFVTMAQPMKTRYTYDLGNRLTKVEQIDGTTGGSGTTQTRTFTYDQRGFLLAESQPELGQNGNGTIQYGDYDSMGHVGFKRHTAWDGPGRPWSFDLDYRYDKAGRMVQVLHDGNLAKEYFYARGTEAGPWGAGKLFQTKRRNEVSSKGGAIDLAGITNRVIVTETFRYADPAGRLSERQVRTSDGGLFSSSLTYDPLGNVVDLVYPTCAQPASCTSAAPARTVNHQYRLGMLTAIPGFAPSVRYHSNGLWSSVQHQNGVQDQLTLLNEPGAVSLPGHLRSVTGAGTLLNLGPYTFDDARNITGIGNDRFSYDTLGRLVKADLEIGAQTKTQEFTYDRFSNLTAIELDGGAPGDQRAMPVAATTNRLANGVAYDQAGNQTSSTWGANRFFDAFNQMVFEFGTNINRAMLYTATDERLAVRDAMANQTTWSLRGVDNKVLRQVDGPIGAGTWQWKKDYVYRAGSLLAAVVPQGAGTATEHYHLDHLGSTRLVTNASGAATGPALKYWPYGDMAEGPTEGEVMRFTGHERDFNCPAGLCTGIGKQDDLDYMHARYYSPWNGRFLGVDPVGGAVAVPSRWNLYAYSRSNPTSFMDQDGREEKSVERRFAEKVVVTVGKEVAVGAGAKWAHGTLLGGALEVAGPVGLIYSGIQMIELAEEKATEYEKLAAEHVKGMDAEREGLRNDLINLLGQVDQRIVDNKEDQATAYAGLEIYGQNILPYEKPGTPSFDQAIRGGHAALKRYVEAKLEEKRLRRARQRLVEAIGEPLEQ